MQGARSLSHTRSLSSFAPFKQHQHKSRGCTVRVREASLSTAAVRVALPPQPKAGQIAAGIQQEAPRGQQIVLGNSRRKYVPFRPDFYSSESVQLSGSCCAIVMQARCWPSETQGAEQPRLRPSVWSVKSGHCITPASAAGSWDGWGQNIILPTDPGSGEHGIVLELDSLHGVRQHFHTLYTCMLSLSIIRGTCGTVLCLSRMQAVTTSACNCSSVAHHSL